MNLCRQLFDLSIAYDFEITERRELARVVGLQLGLSRPKACAVRVPAVVTQSRFQLRDGGWRDVDDVQPVPECLLHDTEPVDRPVQEGVVVRREGIEDGTSRRCVPPVELLVDDEQFTGSHHAIHVGITDVDLVGLAFTQRPVGVGRDVDVAVVHLPQSPDDGALADARRPQQQEKLGFRHGLPPRPVERFLEVDDGSRHRLLPGYARGIGRVQQTPRRVYEHS